MIRTRTARIGGLAVTVAAVGITAAGCGDGAGATTAGSVPAPSPAAPSRVAPSRDWTRFGVDASRSNFSSGPTGIGANQAAHLHRHRIRLPGTVDSSPIYVHAVRVRGRRRDVLFMTTSYGRTLALDASSGAILWRFAPRDIGTWEGSAQITNATPVADPDRHYIYAASPDGRIHKLKVIDGHEVHSGAWPVPVTRDPTHEKIASALNLSGREVIATTGGYIGDAPPYQGHVVTLDRGSGRAIGVFNSLCSDRHAIIVPRTCRASDSAIWARSGAVVEPGSGRLLVATGNGPFDGRVDWGDSVLELSADARTLRQNWTPIDQAQLNATDADLGSTAPALLPGGLAVQGGKDAKLRLLRVARLNGTGRAGPRRGGELQTIAAPGSEGVFTTPAVARRGTRALVVVATGGGTAAYALAGRRLHRVWHNDTGGTSPVIAGNLVWVYDANGGALNVYLPGNGHRIAHLPAATGHWNSPIVAGGRVALPEGSANDHSTSGSLSLYTVR